MNIKLIETPNGTVAVINSDTPLITDGQSALDFAVNAGAGLIAVNKEAVAEDFFKLSTGVAGVVAQKFVDYGYRLAIFGDFSHYTSKPLHDYLRECNKGQQLNFVADEDEARRKLGGSA
jgi:hypothetical protein